MWAESVLMEGESMEQEVWVGVGVCVPVCGGG